MRRERFSGAVDVRKTDSIVARVWGARDPDLRDESSTCGDRERKRAGGSDSLSRGTVRYPWRQPRQLCKGGGDQQ